MSVLRSIESKIESLFEGVFGRAFRANVQPVELARKLVKEMDDHKSVSVSRIYVPNEYTVYLSSADREQFADYEDQLCDELKEYLAEHARREHYVLLTPPRVKFDTDTDLDLGVFGIATRLVRGERAPADAPRQQPAAAAAGATMVYKPTEPSIEAGAIEAGALEAGALEAGATEAEAVDPPADESKPVAPREVTALTIGDGRHELTGSTVVIGRSKDCGIRVPDPNVSRRHAEVRYDGTTYTVVDLDSTNGVEVDGKRVKELALEDGARFTIGSTEIVFSRKLA